MNILRLYLLERGDGRDDVIMEQSQFQNTEKQMKFHQQNIDNDEEKTYL
jgi:hypothetical protein